MVWKLYSRQIQRVDCLTHSSGEGSNNFYNYILLSSSDAIPMNMCFVGRTNVERTSGRDGKKINPLPRLKKGYVHYVHQSAFASDLTLPRQTDHRRVGRPRQSWTPKNVERVWTSPRSFPSQFSFSKTRTTYSGKNVRQSHHYELTFHRGWSKIV